MQVEYQNAKSKTDDKDPDITVTTLENLSLFTVLVKENSL
jgi:hypothetical protein